MALKVMTIVGTRPELISCEGDRRARRRLPHVLVHTGQNFDYELNKIFFEAAGDPQPDHFLEVAAGRRRSAIATSSPSPTRSRKRRTPMRSCCSGHEQLPFGHCRKEAQGFPSSTWSGQPLFRRTHSGEINRKIRRPRERHQSSYSEHARRYLLAGRPEKPKP